MMKFRILYLAIFTLLLCFSVQAEDAKRIVALSPHSVEMLYAIGAGDRIVGTVEYSDYPEEALAIPRIGSYTGVQIENIVALQPDLIIAWEGGNKLTDLKKLKSLGLKLFYSQPKKIREIGEEILKFGELTGLQAKAQNIATELNKRYLLIKKTYSNKQPVRVFYQLWHDPLRTVGTGSWIDSMISDCGGKNIFTDTIVPYPVISLEAVLSKSPEIIIAPNHSGQSADNLSIWKKWPQIDAIKNNHLVTIDGDLLHRFGPRAIDGLEKLCRAIDSARQ